MSGLVIPSNTEHHHAQCFINARPINKQTSTGPNSALQASKQHTKASGMGKLPTVDTIAIFLIFGGLHGWMAILLACLHVCLPAFLPEGCKQEIKVSEPLTHGKLAESWKVVDVSDLYITGERSLVAQPNARIACETVGVLLMQLFRRQTNPT